MSDAVKAIQANLERAITVDAKDLKTADKDRTETFKLTFKSSIDSLLSLYDQVGDVPLSFFLRCAPEKA